MTVWVVVATREIDGRQSVYVFDDQQDAEEYLIICNGEWSGWSANLYKRRIIENDAFLEEPQ